MRFQFLEQLDDAVRGFVENDGSLLFSKEAQALLAAFLVREESLKDKAVAWDSGGNQSGYEGRGPRQANHWDVGFHTGAHKQEGRIGNAGRSSVRAHSQGLPILQGLHPTRSGFVFVVLMERFEWCFDGKMPG